MSQTALTFSDIFPKRLGLLVQILLSDYTFLSTLDYKFLQPPVPAYAGTEGCYEILVFFFFFFI